MISVSRIPAMRFATAALSAVASIAAAPPPLVGTAVIQIKPPALAPGKAAAAFPRTKMRHIRHRPGSSAIRRVATANALATIEPAREAFVNAVQVYPFSDGAVYRLYTAPGQISDIALQPGEVLGAVASGDTVRWVIGDTTSGSGADKQAHILVKPFSAGLATNLVITTDRHSYHLAVSSTARIAMAALSWTYPQDALIALHKAAEQQAAAAPVASGLAVEDLHFAYQITGDQPDWRPLRAFDDGRQTFIEFPADLAVGEAPPLFVVDGKDAQLVNYRVHGRFYVVDRLFDVAELRLGTKHQQIVRISRILDTQPAARRAS